MRCDHATLGAIYGQTFNTRHDPLHRTAAANIPKQSPILRCTVRHARARNRAATAIECPFIWAALRADRLPFAQCNISRQLRANIIIPAIHLCTEPFQFLQSANQIRIAFQTTALCRLRPFIRIQRDLPLRRSECRQCRDRRLILRQIQRGAFLILKRSHRRIDLA